MVSRLYKRILSPVNWIQEEKWDLAFLVGVGAFLYGVSLIFYPAAWILGGIVVAGVAFLKAK